MDSAARLLRAHEELATCDCVQCAEYARCISVDISEGLDQAAAYMELLLVEHQEQCRFHRYQPHQ